MQRRDVLKTAGGIGAAGIASGAGVLALTGSGAAVELGKLDLSDSEIITDDGTVEDVTVNADGEGEYDGIDEDVTSVRFLLYAVHPDAGREEVARQVYHTENHDTMGDSAGTQTFDDLGGSLLSETSYEAADFEAENDGSESSRDVKFVLRFEVNSGADGTVKSYEVDTIATYKVINEESEAEAGGEGSTDMDGENQDP